jgi:hypothetical protein
LTCAPRTRGFRPDWTYDSCAPALQLPCDGRPRRDHALGCGWT